MGSKLLGTDEKAVETSPIRWRKASVITWLRERAFNIPRVELTDLRFPPHGKTYSRSFDLCREHSQVSSSIEIRVAAAEGYRVPREADFIVAVTNERERLDVGVPDGFSSFCEEGSPGGTVRQGQSRAAGKMNVVLIQIIPRSIGCRDMVFDEFRDSNPARLVDRVVIDITVGPVGCSSFVLRGWGSKNEDWRHGQC